MIQGNVGEVEVVPSEIWYTVKQAAEILNANMGELKLYKFLRDQGILDSTDHEELWNKPMPEYEEKGYIKAEWRAYGPYKVKRRGWQVFISGSGIKFIRNLIQNKSHSNALKE